MAEEPVKPRGRTHNPRSPTASFVEWAPTLEQRDMVEPVGGGTGAWTRGKGHLNSGASLEKPRKGPQLAFQLLRSQAVSPASPYSVNRWQRPRLSASPSSAFRC